ncbi:PDGLE domain-containing protein [Rhodococcus oxybenzonivorans]|uniref:PDGLE domain-containing protein n=1 Tax=Rhodococcus oxybenzonivorans TaxID=1990687 RepID=UPI0029553F7B|nr:PDGLE domain-containing protein [Rhodococcus oxybenzonivorans]MDV7348126.1 PDGLE domain-containing protein [Rhodococcus oxybenzonivorans]
MTTKVQRPAWAFFLVFAAVAMTIAGVLSHFADSDPDGLDSATLRGCQVTQTSEGEELNGRCMAQGAREHPLSATPFADYSVGGSAGTTGVAGIVGVSTVFVLSGSLFWLLTRVRRTHGRSNDTRE